MCKPHHIDGGVCDETWSMRLLDEVRQGRVQTVLRPVALAVVQASFGHDAVSPWLHRLRGRVIERVAVSNGLLAGALRDSLCQTGGRGSADSN